MSIPPFGPVFAQLDRRHRVLDLEHEPRIGIVRLPFHELDDLGVREAGGYRTVLWTGDLAAWVRRSRHVAVTAPPVFGPLGTKGDDRPASRPTGTIPLQAGQPGRQTETRTVVSRQNPTLHPNLSCRMMMQHRYRAGLGHRRQPLIASTTFGQESMPKPLPGLATGTRCFQNDPAARVRVVS